MADEKMEAPHAPIRFDAPAPADALGGDGSTAPAAALACAKCASAIGAYYYESAGSVFCARCKRESEEVAAAAPKSGLGRAALYGGGAGLLGAVGYFLFIAFTGWDLALVSIAVGAFVGSAMMKGSRGVGGRRFQVVAVAITYLAVGIGHLPYVLATLQSQEEKGGPAAVHADSVSSAAQSASPAAAAARADSSVAGESSPSAVADTKAAKIDEASIGLKLLYFVVGAFSLAITGPFIVLREGGASSFINLLIIGFALLQAWRMTAGGGATPGGSRFTGPYKLGAREPAT